jgi:hypothetical protein
VSRTLPNMTDNCRTTRLLRRAVLSAALLFVADASPALAAAHPAPGYVVCAFDGEFSVDPGMRLAPAEEHFQSTLRLSGCTSSDPDLHSGVGRTEGTAFGSCLGSSGSAVQEITWNTGRTSTFAGTFANVLVLEPVTEHGVAGQFAGLQGGNVNVAMADLTEGAKCLSTGMRHATFTGVLVLGTPVGVA